MIANKKTCYEQIQGFGLPERAIGVSDHFVLARTRQRTVALVVDAVRGVIKRHVAEVIESDKMLPDLEQIEGVIPLQSSPEVGL